MAEEKIPPAPILEPTLEPQPAVEPVSEPKISEIPPKPVSSRFKIILLVVLGLILASGLVFAGYKLRQQQKQSGAQPTPTPVVVATPTPDPTANWATYTTDSYLIKYPNDWNEPKVNLQSTRTEYFFEPGNLFVTVGFNYDQSLNRPRTYKEEKALLEKSAIGKTEITVAGIKTLKYINKIGESTYEELVLLPLKDGKSMVWINMSFPPGTDSKQFDQILSTFKFLPSANSGQGE